MAAKKEIKFEVPRGTPAASCRGCGAVIYWIVTKSEKKMPVDPDGTSHFATCANASSFRKPRS